MTNGTDYLNASWNYPSIIHSGAGKISELAKACKGLGMSAPLLVTDPGLAELPMVGEAVAQCDHAGLRCGLFSNIQANPTGQNVADGVIAFGGGSGLDAAKAVALMVGRVEMWRGGVRSGLSVAAPFVWRRPSNLTITPFPHPAHRTGHADFPHPALGQDITFSPTTRHAQAGSDVRVRSTRRDATEDKPHLDVA